MTICFSYLCMLLAEPSLVATLFPAVDFWSSESSLLSNAFSKLKPVELFLALLNESRVP